MVARNWGKGKQRMTADRYGLRGEEEKPKLGVDYSNNITVSPWTYEKTGLCTLMAFMMCELCQQGIL